MLHLLRLLFLFIHLLTGIALPVGSPAHRKQNQQDTQHCGQNKIVRPEQQQTDKAASQSDDRTETVSPLHPLLRHNDKKQSRHGKLNPRRIERQHGTQKRPDSRTDNPIGLVQKRNGKQKLTLIHILWRLCDKKERICLIRQ